MAELRSDIIDQRGAALTVEEKKQLDTKLYTIHKEWNFSANEHILGEMYTAAEKFVMYTAAEKFVSNCLN